MKPKAIGSSESISPEPSAAPLNDEAHPLPPSAKDEVALEPLEESAT